MASAYYQSSFGGLRLWLSRISTNRSRTLVKHSPSAGNDHVVQDRGNEIIDASCSVLFDWMDGDDISPIDRLRKLLALVDDQARLFSHPFEGTFLARVGPFKYDVDANGVISAEVEFTAVSEVRPVTPAGAGGIPASGETAVTSAATALTSELADVGMTSTTPAQAAAAVTGWVTDDSPNPRDVIAQAGSLSSQLGIDAEELEDDMALWSAYKATVLLSETVRIAAQAVTADSGQTFAVRVGATIALRALLAGIYPASQIDLRYDDAMQLNDIPSPAWLDPGSVLYLPMPPAQQRSA